MPYLTDADAFYMERLRSSDGSSRAGLDGCSCGASEYVCECYAVRNFCFCSLSYRSRRGFAFPDGVNPVALRVPSGVTSLDWERLNG